MTVEEEALRDAINDALAQSPVDACDLVVEVANGRAAVRGTVTDAEQYSRLLSVTDQINLGSRVECDVKVVSAPAR